MNDEVKYAIEKFKNAFARLEEGAESAEDELEKDGVIQRFEFTFELLWKTLKIFLAYKGIEAKTPRDCFKEAFRIHLLEDEEIFLDMLEDRNKTSHIYDQDTSEEIFNRIKTSYITITKKILINLENSLQK